MSIQSHGYVLDDLSTEIRQILGAATVQHMVMLGAGNLGRVLLQNIPFSDAGFSMDAAFDVSPVVVGSTINGVPVYSTEAIDSYFQEHQVDVVVLTLPQAVAQETVDHLMDLGIRFFWNFTNMEFSSSNSDVIFENIHFADSLLTLSYHITNR